MKLLDRILRRTERDIALAGVMVGSVTAMSKLFPVMEHYSELKLVYQDRAYQTWTCSRDDGTPPPSPWRDFLRWYHGRPQSTCYVMHHRAGSDMVRRCDIMSYSVRHGERKKEPSSGDPR